nr:cysteine-rich receptor-like protein kinase [Tanacetum cinerariifolium]
MQDAKVLKDYWPISLIGSLYKIIAKILANCLVGVLEELVNEVQSAFIVNRQILDGPFILDELIHWCHAKKKETMIFKVDFEKAYDSVRWDNLDDVLDKRILISKRLKQDIRRNFFIGGDVKEKKMSWFKWSRVLALKDKGGLGVSSFFALNRAFLFKWMWCFFNDKDALWSRFIRAVH